MRFQVAKNPNTPATILEKLFTDKDRYVPIQVAKNHNTPVTLLVKIATNKHLEIRIGVAQKPQHSSPYFRETFR